MKNLIILIMTTTLLHAGTVWATAPPATKQVPEYIHTGFAAYRTSGYAAGVKRWLEGSPYANATQLASNCQYLKNIERLYGKYQGYTVLMVKQTISSNFVYAEIRYTSQSIYVGFTSLQRDGKWVLARLRFDRQQRLGAAAPPL